MSAQYCGTVNTVWGLSVGLLGVVMVEDFRNLFISRPTYGLDSRHECEREGANFKPSQQGRKGINNKASANKAEGNLHIWGMVGPHIFTPSSSSIIRFPSFHFSG